MSHVRITMISSEKGGNTFYVLFLMDIGRLEWEENRLKFLEGKKCGLQIVKKGMIETKEQVCTNAGGKVLNKKEL